MNTPDHEQKLHLDGPEKPGIQKTLDGHGDLRNLCGRPRQRSNLDDEYFYGVAIFDFAHVDGASLPFFLFTLPAGALADQVDRQKLICFVNSGWRPRPLA